MIGGEWDSLCTYQLFVVLWQRTWLGSRWYLVYWGDRHAGGVGTYEDHLYHLYSWTRVQDTWVVSNPKRESLEGNTVAEKTEADI